jgi:hypothetical protein
MGGVVTNDVRAVQIDVQRPPATLGELVAALTADLPPLTRVTCVCCEPRPPQRHKPVLIVAGGPLSVATTLFPAVSPPVTPAWITPIAGWLPFTPMKARRARQAAAVVVRAGIRQPGRVLAALTVDVAEPLGLGVVRRQVVVADRTGRRDAV